MRIFIAAAIAATALSTAATAQLAGSDSFTHKSGYVVTVNRTGDWMTLRGERPSTASTFKVQVSPGGRVTGVWEGRKVDFRLSDKQRPVELAQADAG